VSKSTTTPSLQLNAWTNSSEQERNLSTPVVASEREQAYNDLEAEGEADRVE
jgi:hypothetical protein